MRFLFDLRLVVCLCTLSTLRLFDLILFHLGQLPSLLFLFIPLSVIDLEMDIVRCCQFLLGSPMVDQTEVVLQITLRE